MRDDVNLSSQGFLKLLISHCFFKLNTNNEAYCFSYNMDSLVPSYS